MFIYKRRSDVGRKEPGGKIEEKEVARKAMIIVHVMFECIILTHHYSTVNTHQIFYNKNDRKFQTLGTSYIITSKFISLLAVIFNQNPKFNVNLFFVFIIYIYKHTYVLLYIYDSLYIYIYISAHK